MFSGCRLFDAHHVPSSAELQQRPSIYAAATRSFSIADAACQTHLSPTTAFSHDARVHCRSRLCTETNNKAVQVCSDNNGRFCDDHDGDITALQRQLSMLWPLSGEGDEYNVEVQGEQFRNLQGACGSSNRRKEMGTPVANLDPRVELLTPLWTRCAFFKTPTWLLHRRPFPQRSSITSITSIQALL